MLLMVLVAAGCGSPSGQTSVDSPGDRGSELLAQLAKAVSDDGSFWSTSIPSGGGAVVIGPTFGRGGTYRFSSTGLVLSSDGSVTVTFELAHSLADPSMVATGQETTIVGTACEGWTAADPDTGALDCSPATPVAFTLDHDTGEVEDLPLPAAVSAEAESRGGDTVPMALYRDETGAVLLLARVGPRASYHEWRLTGKKTEWEPRDAPIDAPSQVGSSLVISTTAEVDGATQARVQVLDTATRLWEQAPTPRPIPSPAGLPALPAVSKSRLAYFSLDPNAPIATFDPQAVTWEYHDAPPGHFDAFGFPELQVMLLVPAGSGSAARQGMVFDPVTGSSTVAGFDLNGFRDALPLTPARAMVFLQDRPPKVVEFE